MFTRPPLAFSELHSASSNEYGLGQFNLYIVPYSVPLIIALYDNDSGVRSSVNMIIIHIILVYNLCGSRLDLTTKL